jgi:predicted Fe-S protein YdhL (DUF1289 family)
MATTISPCVRNCCLNEQDICLGCFRSLDEIRQWNASTEALKVQVICLAEARRNAKKLKFDLNDD